MKYYLVDINVDVSLYVSCLVYVKLYQGEPYIGKSSFTKSEILSRPGVDLDTYKHLVIDINDIDLIIIKLSGSVETVDGNFISRTALDTLYSVI